MAIIREKDMDKLRARIGEDLFARQRANHHMCAPLDGGRAFFVMFSFCDVANTRHGDEKIRIWSDGRDLVFMGENAKSTEILKSLPQDAEPISLLAGYLSELTSADIDILQRTENDISELELSVISTEKPIKGVTGRIAEFKHSLLRMKRYYEQLAMIADRIVENDAGTIPENVLNRLDAISHHMHYLIESLVALREYVTQAREAYQAQIDLELNRIMKIFTVLTAIFLPLTLIVGWYGMNFAMPEYSWRFGYAYVAALSIAVCALCFFLFKKKKWF